MSINKYHILLGKFIYSIAIADGFIQAKEEKVLHRIIDEILTTADQNDYDTKSIILTKMEFNRCIAGEASGKDASNEYFTYITDNKIPEREKRVTLELMNKVALASRGLHKTESDLIAKAIRLLKLA